MLESRHRGGELFFQATLLAPVRSSLSLSDPPLDDEHAGDVHDADEEDNNDRTALDSPRRTSAVPSSPPKEPTVERNG